MKIGVLYCGFGGDQTQTHKTLMDWIFYKANNTFDCEWMISAVSVPFKEYENTVFANETESTQLLELHAKGGAIDHLVSSPKFISEAEARNLALKPLLEANCDFIILVDSDEFYSWENVENIVKFIKADKFTTWFSFSFKNYVFDNNTYLEEPFTPPRAFRVNAQTHTLTAFYHDNEVYYTGKMTGSHTDFKQLPSKNIPKHVAWIKHLTWPSNERGRLKVQYQSQRWGSHMCSYRWNALESKLEFNPEYYQKFGKPMPKLLKD